VDNQSEHGAYLLSTKRRWRADKRHEKRATRQMKIRPGTDKLDGSHRASLRALNLDARQNRPGQRLYSRFRPFEGNGLPLFSTGIRRTPPPPGPPPLPALSGATLFRCPWEGRHDAILEIAQGSAISRIAPCPGTFRFSGRRARCFFKVYCLVSAGRRYGLSIGPREGSKRVTAYSVAKRTRELEFASRSVAQYQDVLSWLLRQGTTWPSAERDGHRRGRKLWARIDRLTDDRPHTTALRQTTRGTFAGVSRSFVARWPLAAVYVPDNARMPL